MNSNEKHGRQLTLEEASKLARKSSHNFKAMLQPGASVTFEVIANAIDAHLAPREVSDELQGDFAECYISTTGLETLRTPGAGIATVGRVKTAYSHIPLFTHPRATSAEVERDAARYRWLRDRGWFECNYGELEVSKDDTSEDVSSMLDKAIDAALAKRGEAG